MSGGQAHATPQSKCGILTAFVNGATGSRLRSLRSERDSGGKQRTPHTFLVLPQASSQDIFTRFVVHYQTGS